MAWKPAMNSASERRGFSAALAIGAVMILKFELHAIVGDFEARIQHDAMFGAFFVKDGVGVVDVNQDFAAFSFGRKLFEQTAGPGERQVADLSRRLLASARAHQLVVAPESTIDERNVRGFRGGFPYCRMSGNRGSEE